MVGWLGWVSEMHPTVSSVSVSSETQGARVEEVQPLQPDARFYLQLVSGVTVLEGVARQLLLRLLHTGHD